MLTSELAPWKKLFKELRSYKTFPTTLTTASLPKRQMVQFMEELLFSLSIQRDTDKYSSVLACRPLRSVLLFIKLSPYVPYIYLRHPNTAMLTLKILLINFHHQS